jgi:hypothetical protein
LAGCDAAPSALRRGAASAVGGAGVDAGSLAAGDASVRAALRGVWKRSGELASESSSSSCEDDAERRTTERRDPPDACAANGDASRRRVVSGVDAAGLARGAGVVTPPDARRGVTACASSSSDDEPLPRPLKSRPVGDCNASSCESEASRRGNGDPPPSADAAPEPRRDAERDMAKQREATGSGGAG